MPHPIGEDGLIEHFTLHPDERERLAGMSGAGRIGFGLALKYLLWKGRFPRTHADLPTGSVEFVARQVGAAAGEFDHYDWQGRQIQRHRAQIRELTGFREPTVTDAAKLTEWLTDEVCRAEPREDRVRDELLARCREELLEPPGPTRIARIVGSAMRRAEQALTTHIAAGIPVSAAARIRVLLGEADTDPVDGGDGGAEVFAQIRTDPGNVSLDTCVEEVSKLEAVRAIGLPTTLFVDVAPKMLVAWRSRVAVETPSLLRDHPDELKLTLLAAYLHCRQRELTDTLVDLLIATVHRINARAQTKVVGEFVTELKRVAGKENILFRITEAALDGPNETVREAIYPAVPGGVDTLTALLAEYKAKGSTFRQHKQRVFKASYTNHYRRGLVALLQVLEFGSINTGHAPMLEALALIKRYRAETTNTTQYYAHGEQVPVDGVVPAELRELMYRADKAGRTRILRSVHECGVFQTLRERLRCKEIWVIGADRWRNPDEDLPADFETKRAEHYAALRKPTNADMFVAELRDELDHELSALNAALPHLDWLQIVDGRRNGAIVLTPLDAAPNRSTCAGSRPPSVTGGACCRTQVPLRGVQDCPTPNAAASAALANMRSKPAESITWWKWSTPNAANVGGSGSSMAVLSPAVRNLAMCSAAPRVWESRMSV